MLEVIDNYHDLCRMEQAWNAAYIADPSASFFASFSWWRSYTQVVKHPFLVLAVREGSSGDYACLLPLEQHTLRKVGLAIFCEVWMGGETFGGGSGMVCRPGYEKDAIVQLSNYLAKRMAFENLHLRCICDDRITTLIRALETSGFRVRSPGTVSWPVLELSQTWQGYLEHQVSGHFRRELQRSIRRLKNTVDLKTVDVVADNLETQIQTMSLLSFARRGLRGAESAIAPIYRSCFLENVLFLRTLWDGDTPIAGSSGFMDRAKRTFYGYKCAFNPAYSQFSPGTVLNASVMRFAIENGFRFFDFCRGGQSHKFYFGGQKRIAQHWEVRRLTVRSTLARNAVRLVDGARNLFSRVSK